MIEKNSVKHHTFTFKDKEYLVIDMPEGTTDVSCGNHCIGIKPVPTGGENSVDTNGWFHIYVEMFHGYSHVTNYMLISDMIENYCFFDVNPYINPADYPDANVTPEQYIDAMMDYGQGEFYTYNNPYVFLHTKIFKNE